MATNRIIIRSLEFFGPHQTPVRLDFMRDLNLIYGASNTGKSFSLKVLDFMLGGTTPLPAIIERNGYEEILMGFELLEDRLYTLARSIQGGAYKLYSGLLKHSELYPEYTVLQPTQKSSKEQSLSGWLLEHLQLAGRQLAKNQFGEKENLSFRELIPYILVDETSIQSERSPLETENGVVTRPKERSVFRLLLTGADDKSVIPVLDTKKFNSAKATKIEILNSLLDDTNQKLSAYPAPQELAKQSEKLDASLERSRIELESFKKNSSELVENRNILIKAINNKKERSDEIRIHLQRFYQLSTIYDSDIERLEAIEEASFLLSIEGAECSVCGAPPESQKTKTPFDEAIISQKSALAEIRKIMILRSELETTIHKLRIELHNLNESLPLDEEKLEELEKLIAVQRPKTGSHEHSLSELLAEKFDVIKGLSLLQQKDNYIKKIAEYESSKAPSKSERPNLTIPESAIISLCETMSQVLSAWGFPGKLVVTFDNKKHDFLIDGKLRTDNGKGVRAITHAAFKVSLLIYCKKHNLPHPGFIVFDSPLITYRDPLKNPKMGELSPDEIALSHSSVKSKFFAHLKSISSMAQFIILENIDPPENINEIANVETFYGSNGGGRYGLFPMLSPLDEPEK